MQIKRIAGFTRELGKSQGYLGLPVLDYEDKNGVHNMASAWEVGREEIDRLRNGASLVLNIMAPPNGHPPVAMWVGDPVENSDDSQFEGSSWISALFKAHRLGELFGKELTLILEQAPEVVVSKIFEHFQTDSPKTVEIRAMVNPLTSAHIEAIMQAVIENR